MKKVSRIRYNVLGTPNTKYKILNTSNEGFTIVEVIIVIVILSVLTAIFISNFIPFKKKIDLENSTQEFVGILKLARNKALSSENESQFGVYLDTSVSPNKYVLFKGASYALRDVPSDQNYFLADTVEFFGISLDFGYEVVFNRLTGTAGQSGNVSLRLKSDTSQTKIVYISSFGTVSFNSLNPSDAARIKDSRHIHFDYSRFIDTATENIVLNFDNNAVIQTFPISSYLVSGQIELVAVVDVGGTNQTVEIRTHRLNNPDTQFSIHRDRRLNDKSLTITISGE